MHKCICKCYRIADHVSEGDRWEIKERMCGRLRKGCDSISPDDKKEMGVQLGFIECYFIVRHEMLLGI